MMSQLGCVTLAPETIEAVHRGETLSPTEQAQYDAHPGVAYDLLSKIPRLEPIARMIEHQNRPAPEVTADPDTASMRQGTEILRLTLAYENLIQRGKSRTEAVHTLSRLNKHFSPEFFQALVELDPNSEGSEIRKYRIDQLTVGMIVQQEVKTVDGALLVSKGQEVTAALLVKLKNLQARRVVSGDVMISMPPTTLAFVKGAS